MPYIVRPRRFPSRALAACGAVLMLGAASAQAASLPETSTCEVPVLSQPFLYANDTNYYTLAPGQTPDNFEGQGWTLSGGATVKQSTLSGGKAGAVLNLAPGSKAVSPVMCAGAEYPQARMLVRDVVGNTGFTFNVSYQGTSSWETPKKTGTLKGTGSEWTLPPAVNLEPPKVSGWQLLKVTLIALKGANEVQVSNLYIDPYRR
jgi:hypothetical protein